MARNNAQFAKYTPHADQAGAVSAHAAGPVSAPVQRLAMPVALWGGGTALLAMSVATGNGVVIAATYAIITVCAATLAGFGVLSALGPRPIAQWAFPILGAQMVRTMLAPMAGLAVFLLTDTDPVGFWLTLLAVAASMLIGETIAVAKMFGSAAQAASGQEVVA